MCRESGRPRLEDRDPIHQWFGTGVPLVLVDPELEVVESCWCYIAYDLHCLMTCVHVLCLTIFDVMVIILCDIVTKSYLVCGNMC